MDQWFETGRQLVDGVAGTRPGQRRLAKSNPGLNNVGRWVGNKLDWFLEEDEEDDWLESDYVDQVNYQTQFSAKKRPLEAISLRGTKVIGPSSETKDFISAEEDSWPDESNFRVNKWEREEVRDIETSKNTCPEKLSSSKQLKRPLPRSSRRRY